MTDLVSAMTVRRDKILVGSLFNLSEPSPAR
jgi:hypothetical protein